MYVYRRRVDLNFWVCFHREKKLAALIFIFRVSFKGKFQTLQMADYGNLQKKKMEKKMFFSTPFKVCAQHQFQTRGPWATSLT